MSTNQMEQVREVLGHFQELYLARDAGRLDEAMRLFVDSDEVEMLGIGAQQRGGPEWFQGPQQVRDIIAGDWRYWGEVHFDVPGARISLREDTAWLTASGKLVQTVEHEEAMEQYLQQMREMLDVLQGTHAKADSVMMEVIHFGLRRLREWQLGPGYAWPLVLSAVLVRDQGKWKFHTLHWAMPVD
ncbi:MAG: hypothetical protein PWQ55_1767 [Chloroflexota bacterium]|nr:hypothetical protein [Chloroflexota bacterium]